jgi:pyridoxal phosphate enzyme (YggS family)
LGESISSRVALMLDRVTRAVEVAGRDSDEVTLLLASKQQSAETVREAAEALRALGRPVLLGESRVQEFLARAPDVTGENVAWHFIGRLQRNKVGALLGAAAPVRMACVQTVDSLALAEALSRRCTVVGRELDVLVQVNVSGEPSKGGVSVEDAAQFASSVSLLPGLTVRGFMTIGLNSREEAPVRAGYARLRDLRDRVAVEVPTVTELSMGMSGDLEWAIAEGATMVRVGSAVFGQRS